MFSRPGWNRKGWFSFFFLLAPASLLAQSACVTNVSNVPDLCITVFPSNPAPGSALTVTANYCSQVTGGNGTEFTLSLNSNAATIQACPTSGQIFLVDLNGQNQNDTNPCGAASGCDIGHYMNDEATNSTTSPCTLGHSVTWVVTVPNNVQVGGTYNVVVAAGGYTNLRCSGSLSNLASVPITIPLPPPAISAVKSAEMSGTTVNPGDLVLFRIDYSFVNTDTFSITDAVPPYTTLVSTGPPGIETGATPGAAAGTPVTWSLGAATTQTSGEVWMLARVNSGAAAPVSGTVISNTAGLSSTQIPSATSNTASVTVGPGFQIAKSESSASLLPGQNITYTLSYSHGGQSLQFFDSYDNDLAGVAGSAIQGYDGTPYTASTGVSFVTAVDSQNNHYIIATACPGMAQGVTCNTFGSLLRNSPPVSLCATYTVEGNAYIPVGDPEGADAHLIIADNTAAPNVGDAYMIGISLDNFPGNFFLQKNNSAASTVTNPVTLLDPAIGTTITAGVWYTLKAQVSYAGGILTICGKVWPTSAAEPAAWAFCYNDTTPLPCTPRNGGQYQVGWQADGSANVDYYSNLKLFGPDPAINTTVWDTVPTGVSYVGNNSANSGAPSVVFSQGPPLSWTMPGTILNGPTGAITWWGSVNCSSTGAITNLSSIQAAGVSATLSNAVTLSVATCTFTPTPTNSPTNTPTRTPTFTPTNTPTITPTSTPTNTATNTATNTPTNTPTNSFTPTPTNSPTNTPTNTLTNTPTNTPTLTPTDTPQNSFTPTDTPTNTATNTSTNTSTNTPTITPTSTPTDTPTVTNTFTLTDTPTNTFTNTPTDTPTNTISATPTPTNTPTSTSTNTPTVTDTFTPTDTPTVTDTYTPTNTPTNTISATPTPTDTPTSTPTNTFTSTNTPTYTDTPTPTNTFTATPTNTPTYTPSNTATNTSTNTATFTVTLTATHTATSTATSTPTNTPTPTPGILIGKTVNRSTASSGDTLSYDIPLTVTGSTAYNVVVDDTLPANMTFTGFGTSPPGAATSQAGSLLSWNFPSLGVGTYNLYYQAQVNGFLTAGTILENKAWVTYIGGGPVSAVADVAVAGNYTVKVGVYNEAGELVKVITITQFSQPVNSIALKGSNTISSLNGANNAVTVYYGNIPIGVWDGSNSQGDPVSNGAYYIKVDNVDPSGVITSVTQQAVVSRILAKVTIKIYNEAGEVIRQLYTYLDDPNSSLISSVALSSNVIAPGSSGSAPSRVTVSDSSGAPICQWDGRTDNGTIVSNGVYYLEFRASYGNGQQTVIVKTISVMDHPGGSQVVAEPNVATPQSPTVHFLAPSTDMVLNVRIYDMAGELVAKTQNVPGTGTADWGASSFASGLYLAVVDLKDATGKNMGRQVLKLSVRH